MARCGLPLAAALVVLPGCSKDNPQGNPGRPQDAEAAKQAPHENDETFARIAAAREIFAQGAAVQKEASFVEAAVAGSLLVNGRLDDVIRIMESVTKKQPELQRPRFFLTLAHHKSKRYAQARPMWEALLEGGPVFDKASSSLYFYGWCLYYLGEPEHAKAAFEAFLAVSAEEDDDSHFGIGLCDIELGQLEDAQAHLTVALELIEAQIARDPTQTRRLAQPFAKTHTRLGEVALLNNELETARDHLVAAVNRMPPAYEAWFLLSRVYTRLGEDDLADHAKAQHSQWEKVAQTGGNG